MGHQHGKAVIYCVPLDGGRTLVSHVMDEWSANWIVANNIMPTGMFNGRHIASCRIVVL
jgi:hypothetical protein